MVHGGGHHHTNGNGTPDANSSSFFGSSLGGWGGNWGESYQNFGRGNIPSNATNNDNGNFVGSSNQASWFSSSNRPWFWNARSQTTYHRHAEYSSSDGSIDLDEVDNDCEECCMNCCLGCCCGFASTSALETAIEHSNPHSPGANTRLPPYDALLDEKPSVPNACCPGLFLSIVLFFSLLAFSSLNKPTWTMNQGESRSVRKLVLNKELIITASKAAGVKVYNLANKKGKCPSLSGPPSILNSTATFKLARDDYQYDHFYLNAGSSIRVHVRAYSGSANVYLLQGGNYLGRLENDKRHHDEEVGFAKDALVARFVSPGNHGDTTLTYTTTRNNVYILVYENVSSKTGVLKVNYRMDMTTYNLKGHTPLCTDTVFGEPCKVPIQSRKNCVLIQAVVDKVDVHIQAYRRWVSLVLYSSLPFLFFLFRAIYRKRERDIVSLTDEQAKIFHPPAFAPHRTEYQSTSSVESLALIGTTHQSNSPPVVQAAFLP